MKLFVLYVVACFMSGLLLWRRPTYMRVIVLIAMGLAVCFAYLFLNQV